MTGSSASPYLALGSGNLGEHGLGHFGPLHLLLDLVVDGRADVEDGALLLAVPLGRQWEGLHLGREPRRLLNPA